MNKKVQYSTLEERQAIIDANVGQILIEEQNITEGNFLVFSDNPRVEDSLTELLTHSYALLVKQGVITTDKIKNPKTQSEVNKILNI